MKNLLFYLFQFFKIDVLIKREFFRFQFFQNDVAQSFWLLRYFASSSYFSTRSIVFFFNFEIFICVAMTDTATNLIINSFETFKSILKLSLFSIFFISSFMLKKNSSIFWIRTEFSLRCCVMFENFFEFWIFVFWQIQIMFFSNCIYYFNENQLICEKIFSKYFNKTYSVKK